MSNPTTYRRLLRFAPAVLLAVAGGCGPLRRNTGSEPTMLVFANESLNQASVYILGAGLNARRIGTVMPGRTDTLTVPLDITTRGGTLNIVARLPGGSAAQTGPVSLRTGELYLVTLPMDARLLTFFVGER